MKILWRKHCENQYSLVYLDTLVTDEEETFLPWTCKVKIMDMYITPQCLKEEVPLESFHKGNLVLVKMCLDDENDFLLCFFTGFGSSCEFKYKLLCIDYLRWYC